ncbi:MAG: hypothetical protein ACOCUF_04030 [Patescibacteria group bacterium]
MTGKLFKKTWFQVVVIIFAGISIPGYVLWKNIFPDFSYYLNEDTQFGVKIFSKEVGGKNFLVLPELENYHFDKIVLDIDKIKTSGDKKREVEIDLYKGYQALYFKEGESVNSKEDLLKLINSQKEINFPNGGLFAYNDSVNVYSKGFYYPVFSEEVFKKIGYNWEDVVEKGGDFAGKIQEADRLHYGNAHPDGTILMIAGDHYLIWEEEKRKLDFDGAAETLKEENCTIVKASKGNAEAISSCRQESKKSGVECEFKRENLHSGLDYVFDLNDLQASSVQEAEVVLSSTPSWEALSRNSKILYRKIKQELSEKYKGYLF